MSETVTGSVDHSTPPPAEALRHTPLAEVHAALGAKMVPFAGYLMPVHYRSGITAEHIAVRERCGLFDVSHMGEFEVRGPQAVDFATYVTSNDVHALAVGQVQYSTILTPRGTVEDDCLVYRFADRVMLVVNAGNRAKDWAWLQGILSIDGRFDCSLMDRSDETALLALQGPTAQRLLQPLTATDLESIRYYHFAEGQVAGVPAVISRTGYTGEDGFELYAPAGRAVALWQALMASKGPASEGPAAAVTPAGLGARDSLRLEMGMALYGHELDDATTPLEANLGWVVKLDKGDFVGRDALIAQKASGVSRKLVGFTTAERAFPRQGYPVYHAGVVVGQVSSGTVSPTLGLGIGTCYLPAAVVRPGTPVEIEVRGRRVPASVVRLPFYTRGSHR